MKKNVKPAAKASGGPGSEVKPKGVSTPVITKPAGEAAAGQLAPGGVQEPLIAVPNPAQIANVEEAAGTGATAQLGAPAGTSSLVPLEEPAATNHPAPIGASASNSGVLTKKSTPGLEVTSSRDGFWRAGRQWMKTPTIVPLGDLTDEQFDQLIDEPMLSVSHVDDVAAEGGE